MSQKPKSSSFSMKQQEGNFFQDRKRKSTAHVVVVPNPMREVQMEDAIQNIKIIADAKEEQYFNDINRSDYATEQTRFNFHNNMSTHLRGSLPSLPENIPRFNNKSMPRLTKGPMPVAARHVSRRKHKLDINKISSNIHK